MKTYKKRMTNYHLQIHNNQKIMHMKKSFLIILKCLFVLGILSEQNGEIYQLGYSNNFVAGDFNNRDHEDSEQLQEIVQEVHEDKPRAVNYKAISPKAIQLSELKLKRRWEKCFWEDIQIIKKKDRNIVTFHKHLELIKK